MINKKILLSLLTVGLLACIASAGTWAYFQDTVYSPVNTLTTATLTSQYTYDPALTQILTEWVSFTTTDGIFGPFNADNMVPDGASHIIKPIHIQNLGTTQATVTATITPGTPIDEVQDLVIKVGDAPIYTGGAFVTGPIILPLGTVEALGASNVDASISYIFDDKDNQNDSETQSIPFNMSIAVRAIAAS